MFWTLLAIDEGSNSSYFQRFNKEVPPEKRTEDASHAREMREGTVLTAPAPPDAKNGAWVQATTAQTINNTVNIA